MLHYRSRLLTTQANNNRVFTGNVRRTGWLISSPFGGPFFVSDKPMGSSGEGLILDSTIWPYLYFDRDVFGTLVTGSVNLWDDAGPTVIYVAEVIETGDPQKCAWKMNGSDGRPESISGRSLLGDRLRKLLSRPSPDAS